MQIYKNDISPNEVRNRIGTFIDSLQKNEPENSQKLVELCHVGKFISFFDSFLKIKELTESPDFILEWNNIQIGLEHQTLIDNVTKEKEGFFDTLFKHAATELEKEDFPKILANCYLKKDFDYKLKNKNEYILVIKQVLKEYLEKKVIIDNPIIKDITITSYNHTEVHLSPNFGSWLQKYLTSELLENAIKKKESKIGRYLRKDINYQWLLIIIGGVRESSYEMDTSISTSKDILFDKVFVLEDFNNILYELK